TGEFLCDGLLDAYDSTATLINDAPPSWGFITPAIAASADVPGVEIRVRLRARLAGGYYAAVSQGSAELGCDGRPPQTIQHSQLDYDDRGERAIEIRWKVPTTSWSFALARGDTVLPPRPFLKAPPESAPAELRAIR